MASTARENAGSNAELETWLTRLQASDLLRVSHDAIREWEKQGKLHGRSRARTGKGPSMETVYDPREIVKLATVRIAQIPKRADPGEVAARAFEMFGRDHSMHEVVVELRRAPAEVKALYQEWLELGGTACVVTEKHRELLVALVGEFETVSDLVEIIERRMRPRPGADAAVDCEPDGSRARESSGPDS